MKNLYLRMKTLCLVAAMFVMAQATFAQSDLTWNGTVSSDAAEPANWTPEGTMAGNNLFFGNSSTYTNACVITGTEDIDVNIFSTVSQGSVVVTDEETGEVTSWTPTGEVTINMSEGATFRINGNQESAGDYVRGIINVIGGNFHYNRNKNWYCDNDSLVVTLDCDTATFRHWVGFGDRNGTKGGRMNILGHTLVTMSVLDRIPSGLGRVHLYIDEDAELRVNGDIVDWINGLIEAGSIATAEDRDLVVKYDALTVQTIINTRLKTAFVIEPTDRQLLIAGEAGSEVAVIQNDGFASMTGGIEWVYGTVDGTFDMSFDPAETNASITPLFAEAGTYYLALKGNDGTTDHYTNSIECIVSSNKAVLSNDVTQNLRVGQTAFMIEVIEETEASSREWKYATTPGGPYMSFDPVVSGVEFSASFDTEGTYFVVCESTIDGVVNTTKEVQFNMATWNSGALNLTFEGDVVGDEMNGRNMMNWDPAAYIHKNNLTIPDGMTVEVAGGEKDTIAGLTVGTDGLFKFTGESTTDTVWYRNSAHWSSPGSYSIEGGVFVYDNGFLRLYDLNTLFSVKNDAHVIINGSAILLGGSDNPATGANLHIMDNAVMHFNAWPGRVSANAGYSEFRMDGNAKYQWQGDARGTIAPWITGTLDAETGEYTFNPKFITPTGTVPYMVYDPNTDITTVSIRDLSAFGVEQTKTQVVGKGQSTATLSLINSGAYSTFEWKWSTSATGPFESFATPVTGATAEVAFAEAGTYYVVCVGDDTDVTSNAVPVKIVDITVSPATDQYIADDSLGDDATELSYTLPEGATGVQWKYSTTPGGPYNEFFPVQETGATYLPFDIYEGNHYIVYEATVLDDDGASVTVYSNEIAIYVGTTSVGSLETAQLEIYPNPSNGNFTVSLEDGLDQVITIYDVTGNVVLTKEAVAGGVVALSLDTKGVYLVKVTSETKSNVKRVVIK